MCFMFTNRGHHIAMIIPCTSLLAPFIRNTPTNETMLKQLNKGRRIINFLLSTMLNWAMEIQNVYL